MFCFTWGQFVYRHSQLWCIIIFLRSHRRGRNNKDIQLLRILKVTSKAWDALICIKISLKINQKPINIDILIFQMQQNLHNYQTNSSRVIKQKYLYKIKHISNYSETTLKWHMIINGLLYILFMLPCYECFEIWAFRPINECIERP